MDELYVSRNILLENSTINDLTISKKALNDTLSQINFGSDSANLNGELSFKTINAGFPSSPLVNRLKIHTNGYVGIGTDMPELPLHIPEGGLKVGTSLEYNNFYLVNEHEGDPLNSRTFRLYHSGASTHLLTVASLGGRVGIGTKTPQNKLDVEGNAVIGTTYAGNQRAPDNGLLVEGNVGIGSKLLVIGDININDINRVSFHYGNKAALGIAQHFNLLGEKNGLCIQGCTEPNRNLDHSETAGIFMNENTMCLWCPGEDQKFPILRIYGPLNENPRLEIYRNGDITIDKDLSIRGRLQSLNVANEFTATVRAADFRIGHSDRHCRNGREPGRALVDYTDTLHLNYGPDWTRTHIGGIIRGDNPSEAGNNLFTLAAEEAQGFFDRFRGVRISAIMKKAINADKKTQNYIGITTDDVSGLVGTPDGKGINIMGLIGVLTTVVKEQQKEILALKKAIIGKKEKSDEIK